MHDTAERAGLERKALHFIARREERGAPSPGAREIGCVIGLEDSREVREIVSSLVEEGYLVRDAGWRRMLELTERGWRLIRNLYAPGAETNPVAGYPDRPRHESRRHLIC